MPRHLAVTVHDYIGQTCSEGQRWVERECERRLTPLKKRANAHWQGRA